MRKVNPSRERNESVETTRETIKGCKLVMRLVVKLSNCLIFNHLRNTSLSLNNLLFYF